MNKKELNAALSKIIDKYMDDIPPSRLHTDATSVIQAHKKGKQKNNGFPNSPPTKWGGSRNKRRSKRKSKRKSKRRPNRRPNRKSKRKSKRKT